MAIETSLVMVKQYQQDVCNHLLQSAISREELVVCTVCTICIKAITSSLMHSSSVLRWYARLHNTMLPS